MEQGWAFETGVLRNTEPGAFAEDPQSVHQNPNEVLRDDRSVKPRRDALLSNLISRLESQQ